MENDNHTSKSLHNWDKLAAENPIHAAIATADEVGEKQKSADTIALLKDKLTSGVILDVGCGYGRIAKYLLPLRKFERYIGLDGSEMMLGHFRQLYETKLKDFGTPVLLIQSAIDDLPLEDNSVDDVIVSAVFLHNNKMTTRRSVTEIYRVLKPGGQFFVFGSFPNLVNLQGLQGSAYCLFLSMIGKSMKNGPVRYFKKKEIKELLKNFSHIEISSMGLVTIPKRILLFPSRLNRLYQKILFPIIHKILSKLLTARGQKTLCASFDVYAVK
ncbi:MAG: class I SAM-dependent methyltransferase [bacterium]|nr:class I SAM-dependent methyltransferase [bacterium]